MMHVTGDKWTSMAKGREKIGSLEKENKKITLMAVDVYMSECKQETVDSVIMRKHINHWWCVTIPLLWFVHKH